MADLRFYLDPVCPFAWMTSRWVRAVAAQRPLDVEWRFVSLRMLNERVDYAAQFPPGYEAGHTAGLRLLRVAAAVREVAGDDGVGAFYDAVGRRVFEGEPDPLGVAGPGHDEPAAVRAALVEAGLPEEQHDGLVAALDDAGRDAVVRAETEEALSVAGRDVGTPVLHVDPPDGPGFFGPVISRLPSPEQAVELWDHVLGLARFGGFAELKRSLRERPQLPVFGVAAGEVGATEDWHGGSRRQHR